MVTVTPPFSYIANPNLDRALFQGQVYFGQPNTDPTQPANQIDVRKVEQDGSFTVLAQPLVCGAGGVILDAGSPVQLDIVEAAYSLVITDAADVQLYSFPSAGPGGTSGREGLILQGGLPFDATVSTTGPTFAVLVASHTNALILVDASAAPVTINLPSAALAGDKFRFIVKKTDASANSVTIDADGGDLIDGAATYVISNQYEAAEFLTNATLWAVTAFYVPGISTLSQSVATNTAGIASNLTEINRLETNVEALPRVFAAAHVEADGTLTWGYNLSVTRTGNGAYTYTYTTALPGGTGDNVAINASPTSGQRFVSVALPTTTGFTVNIASFTLPDTIVGSNTEHFVHVIAPNTSIPTS